jgi:hypothetical protein
MLSEDDVSSVREFLRPTSNSGPQRIREHPLATEKTELIHLVIL